MQIVCSMFNEQKEERGATYVNNCVCLYCFFFDDIIGMDFRMRKLNGSRTLFMDQKSIQILNFYFIIKYKRRRGRSVHSRTHILCFD